MSDSGYLTNQLLIAMPAMGDPNFSQTVALICDHSSAGALGLILNRPLPMRMGEVFEQLDIELDEAALPVPTVLRDRAVLRGGPMQTDRGFVVHRAAGKWDTTLEVSDALHVTTSRDILAAIAKGRGPEEAFIVLGYAGWDGGQLEQEIRANTARRGHVTHQHHQRQCLSRPRLSRPLRPRCRHPHESSWHSISAYVASASLAATPSVGLLRPLLQ
jgi:putative transcriptional regulator